MAPRKRARDASDVDGEVHVESASSGFRQQYGNKRSRVALAQENGGSVISDDEDDHLANSDAEDDTRQQFSEEEDEDIDELRATQIVEKQIRVHKDNQASEDGVIEEVIIRNFMCHEKFSIHLGPLINFIIGPNGSGKSAVLTALTMCLGGKATSTNRAASLKNLIKEGKQDASLAVKIKNQGEGAYKPELYGRSITVERHFSRSNTSGFKLKNTEGKTISTKKADLDELLDYFAFQLDNPINVLNQDMARQFLSNSTPSDKYKFFIRGTQLEVLDADYKQLEDTLDKIEAKLHTRADDIVVLKQKLDEAERKKNSLERANVLAEKIKHLQLMHAWAQVEEQERELEEFERHVEEAAQRVREKIEDAEQYEGAYEGQNQAWEAAQRALADFQQQLQPVQENRDTEKVSFDKNKNEQLELKTQERDIKGDVNKAKKDVKGLEAQTVEEQGRLAGAQGEAHADRVAALERLKEAADEAKREQMQHGTGIAEVQKRHDEAKQAHQDSIPAFDRLKEVLNSANTLLRNISSEQQRPFAGFRQNMERLVKAVNDETRWRSKPVGPMGLHVKLLKSEWSSQLEKTFGGVLDSFVVTCKEDQTMLSGIMKRVNCTPMVFIGDPTPLNTSGKEPEEGVDTILRVLEINNHAVRNQLIINQSIEQVALIPNRADAHKFMYSNGKPTNVKVTLCMHDKQRGKAVRFEYSRSGAPKSDTVDAWTGESRMRSNREDQIRAQRENVNLALRDKEAAERYVQECKEAAQSAIQNLGRFQRRQKDLKVAVQRAEDAVEEQQAEIDNNLPQDGKLQELERSLTEAKEALEAAEASAMDLINEKDRLSEIGRELKSKLDAAQDELDQAQTQVNNADSRVAHTGNARINALREKNLALEMIEGAKSEQTRRGEKRDKKAEQVAEFAGEAEKVCRRVPVDEGLNAAIIDQRLEKFFSDQRRIEQEAGGSRNEIQAAYQTARQEHTEAKHQMTRMTNLAKSMKDTLTYRKYRWQKFLKYITYRARTTFAYLLSERQFRGQMLINHGDKQLDIKVEPDISKVSDAGRQTKTLSGGEKSFSTICLLLSIWEAMGSPIRCLDEFDVFMDSVNRATSTKMMIGAARRSVGRQFILITPQAMNNVEWGDDVKVHRMTDPERGQMSLPF